MTSDDIKKLDPYLLSGKEKIEAISKLQDIGSDKTLPRGFQFLAVSMLLEETKRRQKQLHQIYNLQYNCRSRLINDAIGEFKTKQQILFMEKFKDEIATKTFSKGFLHEMERLEKMNKYGCYIAHGVSITQKDCTTCESKTRCWKEGERYHDSI